MGWINHLLHNHDLEEVFEILGIEPYDVIEFLYNEGEVVIPRWLESGNDEEEES